MLNRTRLWPEADGAHGPPEALLDDRDLAPEESLLAELLKSQSGDADEAEAASRAALEVARGYASLTQLDQRNIAPLRERARRSGLFVSLIPELPRDVHDLAGLRQIARHLFRDEANGG